MATAAPKARVRKTPYGLHLYTATIKGEGTYGFGNTPAEARASLERQLAERAEACRWDSFFNRSPAP